MTGLTANGLTANHRQSWSILKLVIFCVFAAEELWREYRETRIAAHHDSSQIRDGVVVKQLCFAMES
jgi:hypothetical protein